MRPKTEWAIDSEVMRARGIIVLVKSNYLVKNIENKIQKYRSNRHSRLTFCTIKVTVKSIQFTSWSLKPTKTKFLFFKNVLSASYEVGGHAAEDQNQYELPA